MIIVGASGNYAYTYRMLDHAPWSGFTPTDFIFPSFLFIVGVAQSLSFKAVANEFQGTSEGSSPQKKPTSRSSRARLLKIFKRTAILFALGLFLNWFPFCFRTDSGAIQWIPVDEVRILGVLQRIALAYGISSLLERYLSERSIMVLGTLTLITYVCILHIGGSPDPYGIQTNIAGQIDRCLLGPGHIYREQGIPFDPEGLLSTLPAIVNVLGGYLTGRLLLKQPFDAARLLKGMMAGCTILVLGYLWSYFDPLNKKLWTTSFTLLTIGMDIMLFITIVYWTDVQGRKFAPASFLNCFGKNPILIYLFSELLMKLLLFPAGASREPLYALLYRQVFASAGMYLGSLLQALTYMLLCWTLVWFLDQKKLYLKI
jgi:predicted acyltransferase